MSDQETGPKILYKKKEALKWEVKKGGEGLAKMEEPLTSIQIKIGCQNTSGSAWVTKS